MSYRAMSGSGLGFTIGGGAEGGITLGPDGIRASGGAGGSTSGGGNVEEEVRTQEEKSPPAYTYMDPILPYVPLNARQENGGGGVPWMWIGIGVAGLIAVGGIVYVVRRRG